MIVRFGLHADGLDPSPPTTALGDIRLGPRGLLETIESDLGLPPVLDQPVECLTDRPGTGRRVESIPATRNN